MNSVFVYCELEGNQVAPVSHGCPSALFEGVRVLNTAQEARA